MRRGLVFGKYMPLHRGHQFVIDRAMAECDDVTIVVYDSKPEGRYAPMPVQKRVGWLEMLYPQAENILWIEDPIQGNSDDPIYAQVYADQLAPLGKFDRLFTSEPQYQAFADALGVEHQLVDEARISVPISGTEIRSDLWASRGWIDPRIYASLIQKVVFVGTESAGKSTLARAMASEYETLWVHEFGRELWESQDLTGTFADHLKMARRQHAREEAMCRHARDYLFCDTNAWTTLMWSLNSYGYADSRLKELVARTINDYIWVLCDNDFGWVQDGTRELEGDKSAAFQNFQVAFLNAMQIPYARVSGPLEERVEQVKRLLELVGAPEPVGKEN
jgi:HTH-type transcriptional regulator, transcriptional repressor of NAD biosynthesis genes